ncbi:Rieske 2Fe-2S domain-containing protein [Paraburkholderia unamae]|uniref:Ferredoxin-NADP reductase n=1 Tax=Paraburkholderia unamae TaxID=219649 RepID=A0ABX5KR22_9BURK|nr:Rieske 2Fe-2S domain-containing protein [Paraburkholderia unamae]PVX82448.1 ferredoxin-NADP reductase [Paraburkholderia unamae]
MTSFDGNRWYPVTSAEALSQRHVFQASLAGQELAIWRDDNGIVNAWENRCPHRGLRLSLGVNVGHELRCQYHGWTYESGSGGCTFVPAHRDATEPSKACAKTFAVRESAGLIWVSLGTPVGDPPIIKTQVDGVSATFLRSLPFNVPAQEVAKSLLEDGLCFDECFGGESKSVGFRRYGDDIVEISTGQDGQPGLHFYIQPHSQDKAVVHAMAARMPSITLDFLTRFSHVLGEFRRALERANAKEPVKKGIVSAKAAPIPVQVPVVVATPQANSAEYRCTVSSRVQETADIVSFGLTPVGRPLPQLTPGMHVSVTTPVGLVRQYSILNAPHERESFLIGVKREVQSLGGSRSMHDDVQDGVELKITVPRNGFPLRRNGRRPVLIAGGIGITPILSMAQALNASGDSYEMHYFVRTPEHTPFRERLRSLGKNVYLHTGLDAYGTRQRLEEIVELLNPESAEIYTCGPGPMIDTVKEVAVGRGFPEESVRFEYFKNTDIPTGGEAFEVTLAKSGKTVTVAAGQTLLQACWDAGAPIEASCEQGVCGTCMTAVLDGEPEHHDTYLSKQERASGKWIMPCVSRCKSKKLVLDI